LRRRQFGRRQLLALALGVFATECAATTAKARIDFGLDQALASRYTAFSMLFWIGVVVLLASVERARGPRRTRGVMALPIFAVAILSLVATTRARPYVLAESANRERARAAIAAGDLREEFLSAIYPVDTPAVREFLEIAKKERVSVYRSP